MLLFITCSGGLNTCCKNKSGRQWFWRNWKLLETHAKDWGYPLSFEFRWDIYYCIINETLFASIDKGICYSIVLLPLNTVLRTHCVHKILTFPHLDNSILILLGAVDFQLSSWQVTILTIFRSKTILALINPLVIFPIQSCWSSRYCRRK